MNQKHYRSIYHTNVNLDLMEQNVIQINGGITINVDASVKNIIYVKKDYVGNPDTCDYEKGKYLESIMAKIICGKL